ncbi:MAG: DUF3127 domain-containing protein [Bacteroidales bacterium]|nr:DUF3127 domain-containing protein [Bacteroidales bacterium]MCF8389468.1 DUF3127 domain-containing protein [Bacteroidales bacterium]
MSFEISGKLIEKSNVVEISAKFKKREFVIEKMENSGGFEFIDYIKFQLTQDKCSVLDPFTLGDSIKVSFNLRGRKWEKDGNISYFTNLEAWRIEKMVSGNSDNIVSSPQDDVPMPDEEDFSSSDQEFEDLPF